MLFMKDKKLDLAWLELLITQLKNEEEILGVAFCEEVANAGKRFIKNLSESVGKNVLHHLDLEHNDLTNEQLQVIITALPSALSVTDDFQGRLPIQEACWHRDSVQYIALLAREGIKYDVGGEGQCGGLLLPDPGTDDKDSTLQLLSSVAEGRDPFEDGDKFRRDALKELWESGILTETDIRNHSLLISSCHDLLHLRFEYLSDVYPDALKMKNIDERYPLFHELIKRREDDEEESIQLFFWVALKHFPNELGLLFQKDHQGRTAFDEAVTKYGIDRTFEIILECIPQNTSLPILLHAIRHAPRQYIDDFFHHFPGADQMEMVDPLTGLYPFMVAAASEEISDLNVVFSLLRREPKLVYEATNRHDGRRKRKRKSGSLKEGQEEGRKRQSVNNHTQEEDEEEKEKEEEERKERLLDIMDPLITLSASEIIKELDLLVTHLYINQDILNGTFCREVNRAGRKFMKDLSQCVGKEIFHNLHAVQPTKKTLEAIITVLPSVLSVKNEKSRIPIQQACWRLNSLEYIALLAREGMMCNVGGEGKRGGLFLDDQDVNTLKGLSCMFGINDPLKYDVLARNALKELWQLGLLTGTEIREHHLLSCSCQPKSLLRFEYLSDMYPEALKMIDDDGESLFHDVVKRRETESIQIFVRAAIKHFANDLSFLFQKNRQGRTAFDEAASKYGKDKASSIIRQCGLQIWSR